jgi:tetratricopeptide (TPR) repeat protein
LFCSEDIYAHLGDTAHAEEIFRSAIIRNKDNDQDYLSLALLQFCENNIADARQTLLQGQARIPASGKILWGLGVASVLEKNTAQAAAQFERAVDMLPEWLGGYSTLGAFYFQTGQIAKAREVLERFKNSKHRRFGHQPHRAGWRRPLRRPRPPTNRCPWPSEINYFN